MNWMQMWKFDVFENVPVEALFGQGIVDAGKAVGGLGAINVRRLSAGRYQRCL